MVGVTLAVLFLFPLAAAGLLAGVQLLGRNAVFSFIGGRGWGESWDLACVPPPHVTEHCGMQFLLPFRLTGGVSWRPHCPSLV